VDSVNRVHLLTPPGTGAIAVIRLVGPAVQRFFRSHFSKPISEGRCVHGELSDNTGLLDDPVVVLLDDANVADINLHGGEWVVRSVLALAQSEGFALIESPSPDEGIPLDAVEGQNLLEREVAAHLPLARTELGVRILVKQPAAWTDFIRRATPGPGEEAHLARWVQRADAIKSEITGIVDDRGLWRLLHPPRVAIIGAPNVGKSTLANRLFTQQRVITADLPGTTRDWVGEIANLDGLAVMLVDTPGIRQTDDTIEAQAIARSGEQIQSADLIVVVVDAARPLAGDQAKVLDAWPDALRVVNKVDTPAPAWDLSLIAGVKTVATTGQGVDELRQTIRARFGVVTGMEERWPRWWTPRQKHILEEALNEARSPSPVWPRRLMGTDDADSD
jgi:tRNA modification GTPase